MAGRPAAAATGMTYANGQSLQRMIRPPIALDDLSQLWQECHLCGTPPLSASVAAGALTKAKARPLPLPSSDIGRSSRLASKGARQRTNAWVRLGGAGLGLRAAPRSRRHGCDIEALEMVHLSHQVL